MDDFGEYPAKSLPRELVRQAEQGATNEISHFGVSFVAKRGLIGSGTLVTAGNHSGVLTAHHVAKAIVKLREDVGVIVSDRAHQFFLPAISFVHIPIGEPASGLPDRGPDLSVFRILDVAKLAVMRSKKSFYRLDDRSFDGFNSYPIERMGWWISGTPDELTKYEGEIKTPEHILTATNFVAQATFVSFEKRGDYDFANLTVTAGTHGFPARYGGVSGGGIWFAPLTMDPNVGPSSIGYTSPFLAGVAFCEGDLIDGERAIIGHGPNSIYVHAAKALAADG